LQEIELFRIRANQNPGFILQDSIYDHLCCLFWRSLCDIHKARTQLGRCSSISARPGTGVFGNARLNAPRMNATDLHLAQTQLLAQYLGKTAHRKLGRTIGGLSGWPDNAKET